MKNRGRKGRPGEYWLELREEVARIKGRRSREGPGVGDSRVASLSPFGWRHQICCEVNVKARNCVLHTLECML